MAKMTAKELERWQEQQAQAEREKRDLIARMGSKAAAPRTPAGGNLRRGSLTTLRRVR